jgi:hypothetical protein
VQIDLVNPAAEAGRERLSDALARVYGGEPAAAVGLLLIESPGQGGAGSQRAGGEHDDKSRWHGAPKPVGQALNERRVLLLAVS